MEHSPLPMFDRWMTPEERKALFKRVPVLKGHASLPGSGPSGETCRSCKHKAYQGGCAGDYIKCGLMRANWTRGRATDIRARDAACDKWARHE
jgi:hypothetical protein